MESVRQLYRYVYKIAFNGTAKIALLLSTSVLCFGSANNESEDLKPLLIATASNFITPMKQLAAEYSAASNQPVKIASGASGKLFAQIRQGAPFDAFFSADTDKPQRLIDGGLASPQSRISYALGQLVLWLPKDSGGKLERGSAKALLQTQARLTLANPRLAPYGLAAAETLEALELRATTQKRWVRAENIAQAYQYTHSGSVGAGFIAHSQFLGLAPEAMGAYWHVPGSLHSPIVQDAVVLNQGKNQAAAKAFMAFIASKRSQEIIQKAGYALPHALEPTIGAAQGRTSQQNKEL